MPTLMLPVQSRIASALVLLLVALMGGRSAEAQQASPRNVVFILSDDHRYDMMGFHPNAPEWLETPSLDRMAREGAHLANAFVSTALCSPSRASILSGQYAHRHGVVDNSADVPAGTRFFPQYLQNGGYRTAMIGKWHMGNDTDDPRPGFDRWVSFRGQGVYMDPELDVDGVQVKKQGHTSDILTDYALEWLDELRRQTPAQPFFLYLSHKAVHAEFDPAPRHKGRYSSVVPRYPATMYRNSPGIDTWPEWVRKQRSSWHGVDYMYHGQMDFDDFYRRYAETLLSVDESVGRVLEYLERNGLADNTLVIYMGDNGFSFGEHGLIDKRHAFEESMRVPMLAWAPGYIRRGTVVNENVLNFDVMPSVLELANVQKPADHVVDGMSFLPLLRGQTVANWRGDFLYEYYWEHAFPQTPTQFALRTPRYKYIFTHGVWDQDGLYDLENDPAEQFNLINSPEHRRIAGELRTRLFERLEATNGMEIPLRRPTNYKMDKSRPEGAPSTDPLVRSGMN